jgi:voltage-gated potassium channel Kch
VEEGNVGARQARVAGLGAGDRHPSTTVRLRRWWHAQRILVLGALVAIGAVLGLVGWHQHAPDYTLVDLVYADFRLLTITGGPATTNSTALGIARFLLPLAVGYTALVAFSSVFRDRVLAMRSGFLRNHVIVVGLGEKGLGFVESAWAAGDRVVAIDPDPAGTHWETCRQLGIHTIIGDGRDPVVLGAARIHRARALVVVGPTDALNAEVAARAMEQSVGRKGSALRCLVHIEDSELADLLRIRQFRLPTTDGARLDFFSLASSGAQLICHRFPPAPPDGAAPSIALVGVTDLWIGLLADAARRWRERGRALDEMSVMLIGLDASSQLAGLRRRLRPDLDAVRMTATDLDPREIDVSDLPGHDGPASVYVHLATDEDTLSAALAIDAQVVADTQVVACLTKSAAISELFGTVDRPGSRLRVVELIPSLCTPDRLEASGMEALARAVHEHYVARRTAENADQGSNSSLVGWAELPEALRESNRNAARHIGPKLAAVGCQLIPAPIGTTGGFCFSGEEVERLAVLEHERWRSDLTAAGWRFAPGDKDTTAKTSPHLVAWAELPDDIREYDREQVRDIPEILARVGLRAVRPATRGSPSTGTADTTP